MIKQVAIIGAGIGAEHAAAYRELPDKFAVHTVCDLDRQRAQAIAMLSDRVSITENLAEVLQDPTIDIVDICLPPHLHFSTCVAALEAGKHVVCEKPLVASVHEAHQLKALSEQCGCKLFPVFQYRFGRAATQLKALVNAGIAGKPYIASLETHWDRDAVYYEPAWRGTWEGEQGGAILTHAIHSHDWLSYILGPVASVFANLTTRVNKIDVEDCAALSITMHSGAVATSSVTLGAAENTSRFRFCFSGLTAESGLSPYSPANDEWSFMAREPTDQSQLDEIINNVKGVQGGYIGLFSEISRALDGMSHSAVVIDDAIQSLEFVAATYASNRLQTPVPLPLDESHPYYQSWLP